MKTLNVDDIQALTKTSQTIQQLIINTLFPEDIENEARIAWDTMSQKYGEELSVAVRSSATAEDLPDASFAGQQEIF